MRCLPCLSIDYQGLGWPRAGPRAHTHILVSVGRNEDVHYCTDLAHSSPGSSSNGSSYIVFYVAVPTKLVQSWSQWRAQWRCWLECWNGCGNTSGVRTPGWLSCQIADSRHLSQLHCSIYNVWCSSLSLNLHFVRFGFLTFTSPPGRLL